MIFTGIMINHLKAFLDGRFNKFNQENFISSGFLV